MLLMAFGGVLAALPYRAGFAGGLVFAACEAALVGALADWFAVVALFRHPLGLRFIPHTAIIPNNRSRIIEGIITIVEKDWLSLDFIKTKVDDLPIIERAAAALGSEDGRREIERAAYSLVSSMLRELQPADVGRFLQLLIKDNIQHVKISGQLLEQIETTIKNLYADQLIDLLLHWAIGASKGPEFEKTLKRILARAAADYSNQGSFIRRLSKGLGESLDVLNYNDAARALSHRINRLLVEMTDSHNMYRQKVKSELQALKLENAEEAASSISQLLRNLLVSDAGTKGAAEFYEVFQKDFLQGNAEDKPIITYLTNMFLDQIEMVRNDEARRSQIESMIKAELKKILERYHSVIGHIVREKLESLDDSALVVSLEARVGDDLQWIRINGTVIGGLVGIAQYLILYFL